MATLVNNTGADATVLRVAYDLNSFNPREEEIPGLRVYYSLTGAAGSWHLIPELTTTNLGPLSAAISLVGTWTQGSQMYLIWVDDNGYLVTDPSYTLDNVVISASGIVLPSSVEILAPTNGQAFVQSQVIAVTTRTTGRIDSVELLLDGSEPGNVVGTSTTVPFTFTLNTDGLSLGAHTLHARAYHSAGSVLSTNAIAINLLPNAAPFLTLANPQTDPVLVGTAITNLVTATDDVAVVRVEWHLGKMPVFTRSNAPYTYVYNDSLPCTNLPIRAVAFDVTGLSTAGTNWVTVTNPPATVAPITTNGSEWKYYATSNAPPAQGSLEWFMPGYDRSGWASGFGELGGGDRYDFYPERTVIPLGTPALGLYRTIYFVREFDWPDAPASCAEFAAVFRLVRDDGAAVYLNGRFIYADNLVLTNGYESLASLAMDDGLVYREVRVSCPLLHALGSAFLPTNNVMAVEVHQASPSSSDLSFDFKLWGEPYAPPALAIVSPTNGTPIVHGVPVTVTVASGPFVRAVDLYLDGDLVATDTSPAVTEPQFSLPVIFSGSPRPHTLWVVGTDTLSNLATSAPVSVLYDGEVLINYGAIWKYDDTGTNLDTAWRARDFDDVAWGEGPAQLGYGDGDEATVISFGPDPDNKRPTVYFRHGFDVAHPAAFSNLSVRVKRDDGVVVYLNGSEVLRNNMPSGTIAYTTWASSVTEGEEVTGETSHDLLVPGRNVVAAEVHQYNGSSTDLSFDLQLVGRLPLEPSARLEILLVDDDADPSTAPLPELRWTAAGFSLIQSADVTQPLNLWTVIPGNPPSGYRPPLGTGMFYALRKN